MCMFLHCLSTESQCFDPKNGFKMLGLKPSKVLWKQNYFSLITLGYVWLIRLNFLQVRANVRSIYAEKRDMFWKASLCSSTTKYLDVSFGRRVVHLVIWRFKTRDSTCHRYQSISAPERMIAVLFGLVRGRLHDLVLPRQSGWE